MSTRLALLIALLLASLLTPACSVVDARLNRVTESPGTVNAEPSDATRRLHGSLLVADLHTDTLLWRRNLNVRHARGHVDVPRMLEGNLGLVVFTTVSRVPGAQSMPKTTDSLFPLAVTQGQSPFTWFSASGRTFYQAAKMRRFVEESRGRLRLVRTRADLDTFLAARRRGDRVVAGILGIEGAHAADGELGNIARFADAGFRMLGLVHLYDNEAGGSSYGLARGGITAFGRRVALESERLGIALDLAHASAPLIDDLLAMHAAGELRKPFIVSHTGVRGTHDHDRNLSDAHLIGIARAGGVIGIGFFEPALRVATVEAIGEAIAYTVALLDEAGLDGARHVALGSDFDGSVICPIDATGLVHVTEELRRRGLPDDRIRRIMGENVVRVFRETLPAGSP